ncbi:MAG: DegT/DnrJ/EryC1/StrS family aminotransferase [Bacteroidota bacterium]
MPKKIPFLDLREQYLSIRDEVTAAIDRVFDRTAFSAGEFVTAFENDFSRYIRVDHVAGVNSGTSALHLCLLALGIKPGDEVIVPANTFIATAWAPCYAGAKPVFADCEPGTWNISPAAIERKISPRTKAVIGVHLYGQPFNISAVKRLCKNHGLFLVEDCAQSHGATYENKVTGVFGDIAAFSFYPGKNLGAYGEAGAVASGNAAYIDHIRMLINQGSRKKYCHETIGYNMRMDGVQAAILSVKLRHLSAWTARRREIARMYRDGIKHPAIRMQQTETGAVPAYHLFVITADDRDDLMSYLNGHGIFPGIHYPLPLHLQKAFEPLGYKRGDFPNAEHLSEHCLSLPMYPELKNEDVEYIIYTLNAY